MTRQYTVGYPIERLLSPDWHYAISAWWGFTTADDCQRIERFLRCGTRSGFYRPDWPSVETVAEDAADVLFRRFLRNGNHLLYTLLPDKNSHSYNLRHRWHDRTLASNHDQRNFISRQLHKHIKLTTSLSHSLTVELRSVQFLLLNKYVMYVDNTVSWILTGWIFRNIWKSKYAKLTQFF